jgi:predicted hydrolase (HD superfamily)
MQRLTLEQAKQLNSTMVTEDHLLLHAANVSAAMGAMAEHFGADPEEKEEWEAVGWLHDYDYEKYPDEHLEHTEQPLLEAEVPERDVRAIMSHGYTIVNDVKPETPMEKSLFTVDELTGIVQAAARMRPHGITDMKLKSFMKKWKSKNFAAGCNRDLILQGCDMLGMEIRDVAGIVIDGMKAHAEELQLAGDGEEA